MLKLEKFNSLQELIQYQKELYTIYKDSSVDEYKKDKVLEEILEIGEFLENTTTTNKRLIQSLLSLINGRDEAYQLQILSGIKKHEKIYKYNSFEDVEVEEKIDSLPWNAVVIVRSDVDILKLASNNLNSSLFFRPENYKSIYDKKLLFTYDAFLGDMEIEHYLDAEVNIAKLSDLSEKDGLTKEELKLLDIIILNIYKEEYNKTNNKEKVRVKKVGE